MESAAEKSERKRQREKQRRSDLASAFDILANVLLQIEPGAQDKADNQRSGKLKTQGTHEADHDHSITRLDLIAETVDALTRLHLENTKLKNALRTRGGQAAIDEALQSAQPAAYSAATVSSAGLQQGMIYPTSAGGPCGQMYSTSTFPGHLSLTQYSQAAATTSVYSPNLKFAGAPKPPLLQQQGMSYEQLAHMALQQFSSTMTTGSSARNAEKIPYSSSPPRSGQPDKEKKQRKDGR
ncbi:hypothetical protein MPSEU_000251700 [Mayamaea pseudoterrestris]|nr:hypothetical protein MPSEU_000251700 [Mayamaea pseudoterrestris]